MCLLGFVLLLSLGSYFLVVLLGYVLRSKPTARKAVQSPITVFLSVALGAILGGGVMSALFVDTRRSLEGVDEALRTLSGMFFGGLLGLAVGVWLATKLWRRINLTSTAHRR